MINKVQPEYKADLMDANVNAKRGKLEIISKSLITKETSQWHGKTLVICKHQHRQIPFISNEGQIAGMYEAYKSSLKDTNKCPSMLVDQDNNPTNEEGYFNATFDVAINKGIPQIVGHN